MTNTNTKIFLFLRFHIEDQATKLFALSQISSCHVFSIFRAFYSLKLIVHHLTENDIFSHLFVLVFPFLYNNIPNTTFHRNRFRSFRYETGQAETSLPHYRPTLIGCSLSKVCVTQVDGLQSSQHRARQGVTCTKKKVHPKRVSCVGGK